MRVALLTLTLVNALLLSACQKCSGKSKPRSQDLSSLPYFASIPDENAEQGVVINEAGARSGLNLYADNGSPQAHLVDMSGKTVHTWTSPKEMFYHVEPTASGELFALMYDWENYVHLGLMKLDWESKVVWRLPGRYHHDMDVADNGDIYVLDERVRLVTLNGQELPILDNYIVVVSPEGQRLREYSFFDLFGSFVRPDQIRAIAEHWAAEGKTLSEQSDDLQTWSFVALDSPYDVFHSNTLELLRSDLDGVGRAGHVLTSLRQLDMVAIVDLEEKTVPWSWGPGNLEAQHMPTVLPNGHILIFDNGNRRKHSRVLELAPSSKSIVWSYSGKPPGSFFSIWQGGNQRLDNGNTLIVESMRGRAFEVTPEGDIVWQFLASWKEGRRSTMYRMRRLPENWFQQRGSPASQGTTTKE